MQGLVLVPMSLCKSQLNIVNNIPLLALDLLSFSQMLQVDEHD